MSTTTEPTTTTEARRQRDNANAFRRMVDWCDNAKAWPNVRSVVNTAGMAEIQLDGLASMKRLLVGYVPHWEATDRFIRHEVHHGGGFTVCAYAPRQPNEVKGVLQL